jgi:hypothetical protein
MDTTDDATANKEDMLARMKAKIDANLESEGELKGMMNSTQERMDENLKDGCNSKESKRKH